MDRAAIPACPIMVVGVVVYAAPPNQVSEETPPREVIVSVDVAVGSIATHTRCPSYVRLSLIIGFVVWRPSTCAAVSGFFELSCFPRNRQGNTGETSLVGAKGQAKDWRQQKDRGTALHP